jgi:hypothetical protein
VVSLAPRLSSIEQVSKSGNTSNPAKEMAHAVVVLSSVQSECQENSLKYTIDLLITMG